jgi:Tol biopolymer transport system component
MRISGAGPSRSLRTAAFVLIAVSALLGFTQEPPKDDAASEARIRALVADLGHADASRREAAEDALQRLGTQAEPRLKVLSKDADAEVALRAARLLGIRERRRTRPLAWCVIEDRPVNLRIEGKDGGPARDPVKGTSFSAIHGLMGSPDGSRLAFLSGVNYYLMYAVDYSGSEPETLCEYPAAPEYPIKWSPAGDAIVFVSDQEHKPELGYETARKRILVVDVRSKKVTTLTTGTGDDIDPCWIRGGKAIMFSSSRGGDAFQFDLYSVPVVGGEPERLTKDPGRRYSLVTSPDGRTVAFSWFQDGFEGISVFDLATKQVRRLTSGKTHDGVPRWSPDGTRIAFLRERGMSEDFDLILIDADGRNERVLQMDLGGLVRPSWSPDGEWIAFQAQGKDHIEIFRIRRDGTGLTQVSREEDGSLRPAWEPLR